MGKVGYEPYRDLEFLPDPGTYRDKGAFGFHHCGTYRDKGAFGFHHCGTLRDELGLADLLALHNALLAELRLALLLGEHLAHILLKKR